MTDDPGARLRRRRAARALGVTTVLGVVVALSLAGTGARPEGDGSSARPRERLPTLPEGCEEVTPRRYEGRRFDAPDDVLRAGRDYSAVIHTSCGDIVFDLFEDDAPANVNSFVFLARKGFYDGLPFHRIEKDSVIQSGDPNGQALDPPDGPGYEVRDELAGTSYDDYVFGVVGMANRGPHTDTAGSQFFIVVHDPEGARRGRPEPAGYRPNYTLIGRTTRSSWDTLERIADADTKGGSDPVEAVEPVRPVIVESVDIRAR